MKKLNIALLIIASLMMSSCKDMFKNLFDDIHEIHRQ